MLPMFAGRAHKLPFYMYLYIYIFFCFTVTTAAVYCCAIWQNGSLLAPQFCISIKYTRSSSHTIPKIDTVLQFYLLCVCIG